jgi:hypothetical protein
MADPKKEYLRKHPERRVLSNKLGWIKKRYGAEARSHFEQNPLCEVCFEKRLACLAIHHIEGKNVESFRTLCHNCHAVEHGSEFTFEDATALGPLISRRSMAECGTKTMYDKGCRCEPCKEAKRESRKSARKDAGFSSL